MERNDLLDWLRKQEIAGDSIAWKVITFSEAVGIAKWNSSFRYYHNVNQKGRITPLFNLLNIVDCSGLFT